jgi:hypothetical protein
VSNGLGLFGWIRDGVKQSVLLGVSDAIDTIGSPEAGRELNPAMLAFAKHGETLSKTHNIEETTARKIPGSTGRKRLGRSLRDIEPTKPTP